MFAIHGKRPQIVPGVLRALQKQQEAAVARPVLGRFDFVGVKKQLSLARAIGRFAIQVRRRASTRRVDNLAAVGRPDRVACAGRLKAKPRVDAARQIQTPHHPRSPIVLAPFGHARSIRRKRQFIARYPSSSVAQNFPLSVEPG